MRKDGLYLVTYVAMLLYLTAFSYTRLATNQGNTITIFSGTYGDNCGARKNNVKQTIAKACNNKAYCLFKTDFDDPALGCNKDLFVAWTCGKKRVFYPINYIKFDSTPEIYTLSCLHTL